MELWLVDYSVLPARQLMITQPERADYWAEMK